LSCSGASSAGYQIYPLRLVLGVCCFVAEVFRKVENASGDRRDLKFWGRISERACALGMYLPCNKNKKCFADEVCVFSAHEFVSTMVYCGGELTLRV
jgi:hypothetical protein